jgi:GTPase SAR1 family protein
MGNTLWPKGKFVLLTGSVNRYRLFDILVSIGISPPPTIPACGYYVETTVEKTANRTWYCWDIPPSESLRTLLREYLVVGDYLIWVVDSGDKSNTIAGVETFKYLLSQTSLAGKPLLVLSVDDNNGAPEMSLDEIVDILELHSQDTCRSWQVFKIGEIRKGLEWLFNSNHTKNSRM